MKRMIQDLATKSGHTTSYSGNHQTLYVHGKGCNKFIESVEDQIDEELHFKLKGQIKQKGGH